MQQLRLQLQLQHLLVRTSELLRQGCSPGTSLTVLRDKIASLVQPLGGLLAGAPISQLNPGLPKVAHRTVLLGNVAAVWPESSERGYSQLKLNAGGSAVDDDDALIPAIAEGLERYSIGLVRSSQFTVASAEDLGDMALDLDSIPTCSDKELTNPKCPLVRADKNVPIRWVRGVSLSDFREIYIPAVMVFSHLGGLQASERFWLPISTGCAAHGDFQQAIVNGLCEVVERDAISIVWLQKLPLCRISYDALERDLFYREHCLKAAGDLTYHIFDATLDVGVPTVYGIQVAAHNAPVMQVVACATSPFRATALTKVLRDLALTRQSLTHRRPTPSSFEDFGELMHGATFMAHEERSERFDFLLKTTSILRSFEGNDAPHECDKLSWVLAKLAKCSLEAFAVDISTDETIRAGMRVVRTLVPGLQPVSFRHSARYLGTSRLYTAPLKCGYHSYPEEQLNNYPQPFA